MDQYFKNKNYGKIGFGKSSLFNIENNKFENSGKYRISDYYNINVIILFYKFT